MQLISTLRQTMHEQSRLIHSLQASVEGHDLAIAKLYPLHATVAGQTESISHCLHGLTLLMNNGATTAAAELTNATSASRSTSCMLY